jgi:hypothetical protein
MVRLLDILCLVFEHCFQLHVYRRIGATFVLELLID